jgi:cytoskeleton protein RodZ
MSELGRLLLEARTAKGLSHADVESVTRIRQKWLEALENGEYNKLPQGAVARGFLRTYAAYLGLDTLAALNLYVDESGDRGDAVLIAEPGKPRYVDYRPLEVELIEPVSPANWWMPWVIAGIVVLALGVAAWWFLSRNPGWNPLAAIAPPPPPTATATHTLTPWVVTATPLATITPPAPETTSAAEVIPAATSDILPLPTPTVPASPTPTPRPTATPEAVASGIVLEADATQRTWVRVTVDGAVVEEGFLAVGEQRVWEANQSVVIRTGNAAGVNLFLNGEELGPMGNVGQVVERSWVVVDTGEVLEGGQIAPNAPAPTVAPTPAG